MNANISKFSLSLVAASVLAAPLAFAGETSTADGITKALSESKVDLSFRARYEGVDQDGIDDRADALTVLSRMTINTGSFNGFSLGLEVDNVSALVDNYNSSQNGNTEYPLVVDPTGTDVNQGFLKYTNDAFVGTFGRQRITHNNQRFVGGVAWRQNEQTYDAARLQYNTDKFALDYSYVENINNIKAQNVDGDFHLANATFKINKAHKISAFAYLLDYDNISDAANSTDTFGALYNGKFGGIGVQASYATQSDAGDSMLDYSADYMNLEVSTKAGKVTLLGGYELLGSDNGVGFKTPLATLHKFQGFADKFLGTPGEGVEDIYVTVKGVVNGIKLSATYHDLSSDVGGKDWGNELDLTAAYKINKNYNVLVKFANYSADDHQTDTNKLWLQLAAKF
ncbi:alginate export family protein [Thalassotalea sp. PLHSN55]|uniref:alginate export family protein n=1 Tax=Thalassotalea sp. PLHSN55 TaxID=3435888 RepID=UPI003F849E77